MNRDTLKQIMVDQKDIYLNNPLIARHYPLEENINYCFVGIRRCGKSYMMYQQIQTLLEKKIPLSQIVYVNFEDERLLEMTADDLNTILEIGLELAGTGNKPYLFLDEIQNIDGWEKFVRRIADIKYRISITGSNSKMLSSEIATTLGGRYMVQEVFPYSFTEYLRAHDIDLTQKNLEFKHRKQIVRLADEYFRKGGLPETALMTNHRQWLSSLFSKIFFGALVARHRIRNDFALKVLIRKLAESVKQPLSYSRMASIVSSTGKKMSTDAAIDYIRYMDESWLLLPFENYVGKLQDKEMNRKYYFIDNGLLSLFLLDPVTSLLENIVAVNLRRRYGDECFFFNNSKAEVDFYIPEISAGIQVSYSITDRDTRKRETDALLALSDYQNVQHLQIVTKDEEETFEENGKIISVIPLWKWLMEM